MNTAPTAPVAPLRYRGSNNYYVDIAVRGTDEHLGLAVDYAPHPSNVGCFIVRFIAHGNGVHPSKYTHLTYRESAKFLIPASDVNPTAEVFKGVRLNKIAIKAFAPAIWKHEADALALKLGIWPTLTEWIAEQVTTEGFTITVPDLQDVIRKLVTPELPTTVGDVKSVIEFPKLDAPEEKASALKLVKAPEPDEDEESDDDESDDNDKDWLN